ncbi:TetR/AcrR family transcriptional regulator [Caenispirillum bisanense]|uniref:Transcriptional regulator, TetR family n=1 Tax=Caenispirillum bisanense TaxID=414052 RepID=A0A286GID4_9PROT|nr:TetR/AcrR family transcriptional regulator [Caenispirillum bisanense]SOD94734.1 transcriptional regulator, TetR family [Caenispirillum bisanense]
MRLTREDVVGRAVEVFRRRGFHGTSMADLAAACGILKGSLYHHFPSKDDLALAVLEDIHAHFRAAVFPRALGSAAPADRMRALTRAVADYFAARDGSCLMGAFALEIGASDERFAVRIRAYFDDWAAAAAAPLEPRHGAVEAQRLGHDFVARTQGALLFLKLSGDDEPLARCHAAMVTAAGG